jgi:hypothetical protein
VSTPSTPMPCLSVRRYPVLAELDRRHAWLRPFVEAVVLRLIRTSLSAKARLLLATVHAYSRVLTSTAGALGVLRECPGRCPRKRGCSSPPYVPVLLEAAEYRRAVL